MDTVTAFFKTLEPARLGAIGTLTAVILALVVFGVIRYSQPQMTILFTDLSLTDSSSVITELESRNVPFEVRQEGAVILVPADEKLRLRMQLAEGGLPVGGGVGYEIFDKGDTLGATSFIQNLNRLRALEGELARTISSIRVVRAARVHLVLPEQKLFSRQVNEPTASIMVKLKGRLTRGQVKAIQHIVATAVNNMSPERVSLVDESGELLASGTGSASGSGVSISGLEEQRQILEAQLRFKVEEIVSSVVGPGNVKVQVKAELNMSRVTEQSDVFDPEGQVVRSTQTREESEASNSGGESEGVSVGNELPGAGANQNSAAGSNENNSKTEEIVNFEITKRTRTEIQEAGGIRRLSVAVLIDGIYSKDAQGNPIYAERSPKQIESIAALIRSAVGFEKSRGDQVEVVNLRFAASARATPLEAAPSSMFDLSMDEIFRIAELVILAVLGILVLMFVIRPLLRRVMAPEGAALQLAGQAGGQEALAGPTGSALASDDDTLALEGADVQSEVGRMIDVAKVTGSVHDKSVRQVAGLVKSNPDEAVTIVRQWLHSKEAA
ncbi:MAG: flagellar basal-body MS-ring/collar protein FliF [Alphaproteobacteria bacterium]